MESLRFRAISPDNIQDAEKIANSFSSYSAFSWEELTLVDFWSSRAEDLGVIGIIAESPDHVLAAVALRPDAGELEVLGLVVDPSLERRTSEVAAKLSSHISYIASRLGVSSLYQLAPVGALPLESSVETALIEKDDKLWVYSSSLFAETETSVERLLFPPQKHQMKIRELLSPWGSNITFVEDRIRKNDRSKNGGEAPQFVAKEYLFAGFKEFSLIPGPICLSLFTEKVSSLCSESIIKIALSDPRCPELCELLESEGFFFAGVAPDTETVAAALFSRHPITLAIGSNNRRIKTLAAYLKSAATPSPLKRAAHRG